MGSLLYLAAALVARAAIWIAHGFQMRGCRWDGRPPKAESDSDPDGLDAVPFDLGPRTRLVVLRRMLDDAAGRGCSETPEYEALEAQYERTAAELERRFPEPDGERAGTSTEQMLLSRLPCELRALLSHDWALEFMLVEHEGEEALVTLGRPHDERPSLMLLGDAPEGAVDELAAVFAALAEHGVTTYGSHPVLVPVSRLELKAGQLAKDLGARLEMPARHMA